jgi:DNA-binding NarL/FixJ family response regulator
VIQHPDVHLFLCNRGEALPRWREAFACVQVAELGLRGVGPFGQPPCVVWLRLDPGADLASAVQHVDGSLKSLPLVVLSDLPTDEEALAAFSAGARGYCNTHAAPEVLQQVASVVLQGGLWIGQSLMSRLLSATARMAPLPAQQVSAPGAWIERLTEREREVAVTLATGASNKEIGRLLGITERTVKSHIGAILDKLQLRDRLQLALVVNGRAAPPAP